ncbi:cilia- and flagella-associated protein 46-like, partial [Actinia tenebrosa]|uniref:Cilia- and flagella-associated protein 46-like n=1 Tax=Actinia tenebrosa TaxID=6105 RepID=A0A6P8HIZ7_ACTTE
SLKGDQKFWLQTTLLLVEACLYKIDKRSQNPNKPDKEALEKARGIIVDAKSLFQGLSEENENKANLSDYIEAILEARHGILLFDYLVNDESKEKDEETLMNCDNAYQYLRGAREKLAQLGYRREAARVMRKQAAIKRMLADGAKTTDERHEYFLQAYSILMEATNIADAVMYDAQQASPLYEMRMVSLPVQREAVDVHLDLTDLMVSMFLCYSQEDRNRRQLEARKGSMQKMIDDFVKSEAVLCSEEKQEWKDTCSSLAVDAMMQLSLVSGMTNGLPHLRAKVMHSLGVCLRALSAHSSPDADNQWKELEQNRTLDLEKETIENQSQESKENSQGLDGVMKANTNESREILKYTTQAFNLNRVYTTSRKYLCQAVECLSQAVQIALKGGLRDIVSQASHQLVECIGTHDPASSAQYLALYQSCYMSQCLEKVLYRAQADPAVSRLAALLRQRKFFSTVDYLTEHSSAVVSLNHNNLGDCEAWRRLSIMKNHLELTKEFSVTNLQFVVLQHSPDRRYLYGAVLDKGRSAVASAKPAKQAGAVPVPTKAVVTRAEVNPKDLDDLIEEFNHFKSDTATELTRRNFVCHQHERQQKMLDRVEEHPTSNQESNSIMIDTALEHQEAKLQSHFQDVLAAMEAYLDPVLTKLYPALNAESMSGTIVLLADDKLLLLPLESLSAFLTPRVTSLTRDFSLQFLYHRFHQNEENEHKGDAKKGGGKKGDKKPEKPSTAKSKPSDKKVMKIMVIFLKY